MTKVVRQALGLDADAPIECLTHEVEHSGMVIVAMNVDAMYDRGR